MTPIRPLFAFLGALAAASGCGDPVGEPVGSGDTIPPLVTDIQPAPLARDVPVSAVITVRFSEPINPATVGPASFLVRKGFDSVPGAYAFGDSTASFVPENDLAFLASYSVTMTRGIRDSAGNQLAADTAWAFQTMARGTPAAGRR